MRLTRTKKDLEELQSQVEAAYDLAVSAHNLSQEVLGKMMLIQHNVEKLQNSIPELRVIVEAVAKTMEDLERVKAVKRVGRAQRE